MNAVALADGFVTGGAARVRERNLDARASQLRHDSPGPRETVGALYLIDLFAPSFLYARVAKPVKARIFPLCDIVRLLTSGLSDKECAP